jgi:hypothetical protein
MHHYHKLHIVNCEDNAAGTFIDENPLIINLVSGKKYTIVLVPVKVAPFTTAVSTRNAHAVSMRSVRSGFSDVYLTRLLLDAIRCGSEQNTENRTSLHVPESTTRVINLKLRGLSRAARWC